MRPGGQGGVLAQVRDQVRRRLRRAPIETGHTSGGIETAAQQLRRPASCCSERCLSSYDVSSHTDLLM
jgi:hypothetical protein